MGTRDDHIVPCNRGVVCCHEVTLYIEDRRRRGIPHSTDLSYVSWRSDYRFFVPAFRERYFPRLSAATQRPPILPVLPPQVVWSIWVDLGSRGGKGGGVNNFRPRDGNTHGEDKLHTGTISVSCTHPRIIASGILVLVI